MSTNRYENKIDINSYKSRYDSQVDVEAEWLSHNARERVNSIQYLLRKNAIDPQSILDLGCGTGETIREMQNREIGESFVGIDYSEEAIKLHDNFSDNVISFTADIVHDNFSLGQSFDLGLLVHVLQHLKDPDACLRNILKQVNMSYLIIEVPMEDLILNKLPQYMGWREANPAKSLQFFNVKTLNNLLSENGLEILDYRKYVPVFDFRTIRVLKSRYNWSKVRTLKKAISSHYIPRLTGKIWANLYYGHYAVLCRKKV
jgi:SAM-dependent methyltransferase